MLHQGLKEVKAHLERERGERDGRGEVERSDLLYLLPLKFSQHHSCCFWCYCLGYGHWKGTLLFPGKCWVFSFGFIKNIFGDSAPAKLTWLLKSDGLKFPFGMVTNFPQDFCALTLGPFCRFFKGWKCGESNPVSCSKPCQVPIKMVVGQECHYLQCPQGWVWIHRTTFGPQTSCFNLGEFECVILWIEYMRISSRPESHVVVSRTEFRNMLGLDSW